MNLLITNGRVLSDKIIINGAIAIENNKIIDIGESAALKKKITQLEKDIQESRKKSGDFAKEKDELIK